MSILKSKNDQVDGGIGGYEDGEEVANEVGVEVESRVLGQKSNVARRVHKLAQTGAVSTLCQRAGLVQGKTAEGCFFKESEVQ